MDRAKIIVIEGTDGSGKETQSERLREYLTSKGLNVKVFSFPDYDSPTGRIVGGPYLGKTDIGESFFPETSANVDPIVSIMYYAADRRYKLLQIEEELYNNDVIIFDRYIMSNMGHQAGKAKDDERRNKVLRAIELLEYDICELPKPDAIIFLHMPFEAAKELRKDREVTDGNESNEEHLKNAEVRYAQLAKIYGWYYINCIKTDHYEKRSDIKLKKEVNQEINELVDSILDKENVMIQRLTRY